MPPWMAAASTAGGSIGEGGLVGSEFGERVRQVSKPMRSGECCADSEMGADASSTSKLGSGNGWCSKSSAVPKAGDGIAALPPAASTPSAAKEGTDDVPMTAPVLEMDTCALWDRSCTMPGVTACGESPRCTSALGTAAAATTEKLGSDAAVGTLWSAKFPECSAAVGVVAASGMECGSAASPTRAGDNGSTKRSGEGISSADSMSGEGIEAAGPTPAALSHAPAVPTTADAGADTSRLPKPPQFILEAGEGLRTEFVAMECSEVLFL